MAIIERRVMLLRQGYTSSKYPCRVWRLVANLTPYILEYTKMPMQNVPIVARARVTLEPPEAHTKYLSLNLHAIETAEKVNLLQIRHTLFEVNRQLVPVDQLREELTSDSNFAIFHAVDHHGAFLGFQRICEDGLQPERIRSQKGHPW